MSQLLPGYSAIFCELRILAAFHRDSGLKTLERGRTSFHQVQEGISVVGLQKFLDLSEIADHGLKT
ncbi:hypothetical protein BRCON_0643 [Candidatus Sumerlaea chitinivorans]|uniref:Uncharacterized protein n=1 Tax=Sumerlaea chitinivorans TaxID=2250252 RepID=A0A2Z4Y2V0_SUMC1|nr:hypothetical protein BRCON_0643 [Candidatus Sumerlaea chitinivorans]